MNAQSLKELLDRITPGPWRVMNTIIGTANPRTIPREIVGPVHGSVDPLCEFSWDSKRGDFENENNARAIALVRELLAVAVAAEGRIKPQAVENLKQHAEFMLDGHCEDAADKQYYTGMLMLVEWYERTQAALAALDAKMNPKGENNA